MKSYTDEPQSSDLIDLIYELRADGYEITAGQATQAHNLLVALMIHDDSKNVSNKLQTYLGPIFCTTPEEQTRFQNHFQRWAPMASKSLLGSTADQQNEIPPRKSRGSFMRLKRWGQVTSIVIAVLFVVWIATRPSGLTGPGLSVPTDVGSVWELFLALGILLVLGWFWWFDARASKDRRFGKKLSEQERGQERLTVPAENAPLPLSATLRRTADEMKRQRPFRIEEVDIVATIEKTLKEGPLTPVFNVRKAAPEYLVLIDRDSFSDQRATLHNEIINKLIHHGVYVDRYFFQSDPRICRREGRRFSNIDLRELAAQHSDHNLIVFSDAEGMFDPITGQPHRWMKLFSLWLDRAFFMPWNLVGDQRSTALSEAGFLVLPSNAIGIELLAKFANGNHRGLLASWSKPLPDLIWEKSSRWLQPHPPAVDLLEELCGQLRAFLGKEGYHWLASCAVYPELHWDLTLYIGKALKQHDELSIDLWNLMQLPWFREGLMPDWLRNRLIRDLPEAKRKVVRRALGELLLRSRDSTQEAEFSSTKILHRPMRTSLSEWWRTKTRMWREAKNAYGPTHEYIFVSFISSRTNSVLDVVNKILELLGLKRGVVSGSLFARVSLTFIFFAALGLLALSAYAARDFRSFLPNGMSVIWWAIVSSWGIVEDYATRTNEE